jgi:hypothetical protein
MDMYVYILAKVVHNVALVLERLNNEQIWITAILEGLQASVLKSQCHMDSVP